MKDKYLENMKKELLEKKIDSDIYTIYFWWWTPSEFEIHRFLNLFEFLKNNFNLNQTNELSIELNPKLSSDSSFEDVLNFIEQITNFFLENINNETKIRFSIWIQSLNNKILQLSNRNYDFEYIKTFLQAIWKLKNKYNQLSFNLDFISFWLEEKKDFEQFENFVKINEKLIDSYSIYTLELFNGSIWKDKFKVDDNKILNNFKTYYEIIKKYNYKRYEISNFAKKWKESLHNMVYWELKPYIWIWTSASGLIIVNSEQWENNLTNLPDLTNWNKAKSKKQKAKIEKKWQKIESENYQKIKNNQSWNPVFILKSYFHPEILNQFWHPGIRYTNSYNIQKYNKWKFEYYEKDILTEDDLIVEKVFLWLRTSKWIILDKKIETKIDKKKLEQYITLGYIENNENKIKLTDKWFDIYNFIITDILEF